MLDTPIPWLHGDPGYTLASCVECRDLHLVGTKHWGCQPCPGCGDPQRYCRCIPTDDLRGPVCTACGGREFVNTSALHDPNECADCGTTLLDPQDPRSPAYQTALADIMGDLMADGASEESARATATAYLDSADSPLAPDEPPTNWDPYP
jgi:hypothetical protein